MNIFVVSRGFPTEKYKTYGIFEFDLAKALANAGHNVVFCVVDLRSFRRKRNFSNQKFRTENVDVFVSNLPLGAIPKRLLVRLGRIAFKKVFKAAVKEHGKPDIIHTHFADISLIASSTAKKHKIPIVMTEHSSKMNSKELTKSDIVFAKKAYKDADLLLSVSKPLSENIKKLTGYKSLCIPNIVDTKTFCFNERENENIFRFVCAGSLIERKNIGLVIDAFLQIQKKYNNIQLIIIGDGPLKKTFEEKINCYNKNDNIKLKGLCSRKEMAKFFNESDCFVLASKAETFGVVYIEAMSTGLPVIASKCGGPEDFINESNGILVEVDNKQQLVSAMEQMILNKHFYNRKEISECAKKNFSPETISDHLTKAYKSLMKK